MGIYDNMLEMHKTQAQTENLQASAQESMARGQMFQEQTKAIVTKEAVDQRTRDALQMLEKARGEADAADQKRAQGGDAPQPIDPIDENIVNAGKEYKKAQQAASAIAASGGDTAEVDKARTAALKARETLYHSINAKTQQELERTKLLGQAAQAGLDTVTQAGMASPDERTLDTVQATQEAVRRMDAILPGWSKQVRLDRDLHGDTIPGPKTTAAFQQTMKAGTARSDQLHDQQKAVDAKLEEARQAQRIIEEKGRDRRADQTATVSREKTQSAEERAAASLAMRDVLSKRKYDAMEAAKHPNSDLPKVYKEPTEKVAERLTAVIKAGVPGITDKNAKLAVDDYHHNVYDYRKAGIPRPEAEARALADVKAGITAGSKTTEGGIDLPIVGNIGGDDKIVPQTYDRTKRSTEPMPKATLPPEPKVSGEVPEGEAATERAVTEMTETAVNTPTPEIAMKLDRAKVQFTMTGGTIRFPDPKTANKGIAMLDKGTLYIGPDGKTYPAP